MLANDINMKVSEENLIQLLDSIGGALSEAHQRINDILPPGPLDSRIEAEPNGAMDRARTIRKQATSLVDRLDQIRGIVGRL